jgi:hypothetical protein
MAKQIKPEDLVIHFLNVGFGDNIIVEFPADDNGIRKYGLVDCKDGDKTLDYLDKLMPSPASVRDWHSSAQPTLISIISAA